MFKIVIIHNMYCGKESICSNYAKCIMTRAFYPKNQETETAHEYDGCTNDQLSWNTIQNTNTIAARIITKMDSFVTPTTVYYLSWDIL